MSEKTPWTPGPWVADFPDDDENGAPWNIHILVASSPDLRICFMAHDGTNDNLTGEANAHLIAATPEMADSATEFDRLSLVIESAVRYADPKHHKEIVLAIKQNRAALAKARGET